MYVPRFSLLTFLSRFRHSRWLLSFILGSFFAASCSKAGDRPTAADLSKIEITLQRSPCLGSCPVYKVAIHGDGRVVFTAVLAFPVVLPDAEDRIPPGTVAALFEQFRKAGFFGLRSSYRSGDSDSRSDSPKYVLTVDTGQRHKSVEDHLGQAAGMPKVVTELERAVDKVAGTDRWVRGNAGLIAWLEGQRFDFHSPEAAQLAVRVANGWADEAVVLALIDHGAPLDAEVSIYRPEVVKAPAGVSLMGRAIRRGQVTLFNKLVADGWLDSLGNERAAQLFAQSAAGCSPALVDVAADAGIGIDTPAPLETFKLQGRTALASLAMPYVCRKREADRVATARRLLARGANPNQSDSLGHTPLFGVVNPDLVNLLLAHGAERRQSEPNE